MLTDVARLRLAGVSILALVVLFLTSVHWFLDTTPKSGSAGLLVPPLPATKTFVLVVDSFRPEDAADPRLTFLHPLRTNGFYAEVEPCMENLTVPCVSEAFTGTVSAGLLGAYHNLVSASAITTTSLFSDVQSVGRTTAVIDNGEYKGYRTALTRYHSKGKKQWEQVEKYVTEGIDLIVWHYPGVDDVAHHHAGHTPQYTKAIETLNTDGLRLQALLGNNYRMIVAGDHGHTPNGRHIAGLDIPTVLMVGSEILTPIPIEGRIPISSYRFAVGAATGFLPPPEYEGFDLTSHLPEGSALRTAAEGRTWTPRVRPEAFPTWVLLAAALLVAGALWVAPARVRPWLAGGYLLSGVYGYLYLWSLTFIHNNPAFPRYQVKLFWALAAIGAIGWIRRGDRRLIAGALGLLAVCYPGTLYPYGFFYSAPQMLAAATIFLAIPGRLLDRRFLHLVAVVIVFSLCWHYVGRVSVINFTIRWFTRLRNLEDGYTTLAWIGFAAWFAPGRWRRVAAGILAGIGACGATVKGGWPLAGVTLAIPVAAFLAPRWLPVVASFAVLPWYGPAYGIGIPLCALFMVTIAWLSWPDEDLRRWFVPLVLAALAYFSMAYGSKMRASGLDFTFALAWLPGDLHWRLWPVVVVAMLVKVFLPPALVVLSVRRFLGDFEVSSALMGIALRLAGAAMSIVGMLIWTADPPRYRLMEQIEDILVWVLVAVVVSVFGWRRIAVAPATATR